MAAKKSTTPSISTLTIGNRTTAVRALPKVKGSRPAVILLHERYGIDQHTKDLTVKLAEAGFVGLAPDLFSRFTGDRKALQRGQVRVELRDDQVLQDLGEVVNYLKKTRGVDASRIAIVGVCQTGRQALLLAAHRTDIAASVVLYGAIGGKEWLTNEMRPEPVQQLVENCTCPVLGIFGEADHIISIDDVLKFRGCLEQAKNTYHVRIYRDAPHGWLNDTMPGRYRKQPANHAWNLIISFLHRCFNNGWDPNRVSWIFESNFAADYDFTKNVRME